jgi:AraC-like DNA-binding protein
VSKHYIEFQELSFYSEKLNITKRYLGEIVKTQLGVSPKSIINKCILNEAKSLLAQTDISIKEISYLLNFSSPSYFIYSFNKQVKITPQKFREARRKS